jgi:hypothetical protein
MATIKKAQNGALAKGSKPGEMSGVQISDKDVMTHPQDFQHLRDIPKYKKMLDPKTNKYYPKKKMKNGGSLTGLSASNKRDKGIDPKGAYTKVQKKALAGAKGKASLTKDKQLGATKMKMGGSLKAVGADKPGLKKLPTAVRNKMGYQKNGGATKAKCGTCMPKKKK